MAEKLEFDLVIKNNQLLGGLNEAIKKSEGLGDALSTALGVAGGQLAVKGLEAIGRAIGQTIEFAKESVQAFSEQEDALNGLAQALRASGEYSATALDEFSKFAGMMQKSTIYADEVVLSQLAVAKSFGATNAQAKSLVLAAANMSATFGGDLDSNLQKLGKTLNGSLGKLAQFIPELKGLTREQLASAEAAEIVNSKFGGAANSQLNTYSGSVTGLKLSFGEIQEEIGRFIAKNSITGAVISGLKSGFDLASAALRNFNDAMRIGVTPVQEQQNKLRDLGSEYNHLTDRQKENLEVLSRLKAAGGQIWGERSKNEVAKEMVANEARMNEILRERINIRSSLKTDKDAANGKNEPRDNADQATLDNRKKLNDEIVNLDAQLALEQETFKEQNVNMTIAKEQERNDAELQRMREYEAQKIELDAELKDAEAQRIDDFELRKLTLEKNARAKELAFIKADANFQKKEDEDRKKNKEKTAKDEIAIENAKQVALAGMISAGANLATAVLKDGSKEQLAASKAAAIAQAWISTETAMANALALPLPPPAPEELAAKYQIMGSINIAAIAATAIKGFATGGVIGGDNGATMGGDNTTITAREGEMMLNADQQKRLWDMISGEGDIRPVIIQVDGREIARTVRDQKKAGFRI